MFSMVGGVRQSRSQCAQLRVPFTMSFVRCTWVRLYDGRPMSGERWYCHNVWRQRVEVTLRVELKHLVTLVPGLRPHCFSKWLAVDNSGHRVVLDGCDLIRRASNE